MAKVSCLPARRGDQIDEEMRGLGTHMQLLGTGQCVEPQGNASIAVVIDRVRRKRLAANPEIG
jgi:hypothetical protein